MLELFAEFLASGKRKHYDELRNKQITFLTGSPFEKYWSGYVHDLKIVQQPDSMLAEVYFNIYSNEIEVNDIENALFRWDFYKESFFFYVKHAIKTDKKADESGELKLSYIAFLEIQDVERRLKEAKNGYYSINEVVDTFFG